MALTKVTGDVLTANVDIASPVFSGTATGTYTLAGTPTITAPVLSGTATGTYTLAGTPTITAPVFSGTATGTYTLGGTPSLAATALTGTIAAARLPAGSVLQVISATDSTERNTTSTSFGTASNTLSVITPTASTSKFFIICNANVFKATAGSGFLTIYRNSTNLGGAGGMSQFQQAFYSSSCITYLDSPATSSTITYQLYFRSSDSNPAYIQATNGGGTVSSFTVFEIAS